MTLEILMCSLNKGIVRVEDVLLPQQRDIHYVVSFQYTDERYLDLIPASLTRRQDVSVYKYFGQGLSANRNLALEKATADLIMFADDDTHISPSILETANVTFERHPDLDVAFFCASTYTGKPLKNYPKEEFEITKMPESYFTSSIEMICRRVKVQGCVRFDERFGLGTKFLTCGEEEIWLEDALKQGLKIHYFPLKIVETSTMLKKSLIYVDAGVQRSRGAINYYLYGKMAWFICFRFALSAAKNRMSHFWPLFRHLCEGIRYMRRTQ